MLFISLLTKTTRGRTLRPFFKPMTKVFFHGISSVESQFAVRPPENRGYL